MLRLINKLCQQAFAFSLVVLVTSISFSAAAVVVAVDNAHVRATIPGTSISAAYMTIKNEHDHDIELVKVFGKISNKIELHEHSMANGMMKMRQVPSIVIPAHGEVKLQPYGYHVMLFNLLKPLVAGEEITLTFQFYKHPSVEITIPVQSIKQQPHH